MEKCPEIIDGKINSLAEVLRDLAPKYKELSISTGYWDLKGTLEIINQIKDYKSIRILIGQEPFSSRRVNELKNIYESFPEQDISSDLTEIKVNTNDEATNLRNTAKILATLMKEKHLEVRVCRKPFLHAKTYIFGSFDSPDAIGIIGSSNFTYKGLSGISDGGNAELNAIEQDPRIVQFSPHGENRETGHLHWFETMWNSEYVEQWTGDFSKILRDSPMGDLTFGPYDVYIKTLMEVFPDELIDKPDLGDRINDILYSFQNRNAGILINKLNKMGMAILADSVGLGKTITAGAVIDYFIKQGKKNIVVMPPASLKQQWRDDLASVFGLRADADFQVISQQDLNAIDEAEDLYNRTNSQVDLFVIDEAHNLRNSGSKRYDRVLEFLRNNEDSKVLMLTATPINNSLNDLTSQIQLGLKGTLDSVLVPYYNPQKNKLEQIDFFDAIKRLNGRSLHDSTFDWQSEEVKQTIMSGISHYLVRSTRQGVQAEGQLKDKTGKEMKFPESRVKSVRYEYADQLDSRIASIIRNGYSNIENIESLKIDVRKLLDATSRSMHPLDFVKDSLSDHETVDAIPNLFQLVLLLGFAPYKPETYQHKIYAKTEEQIAQLGLKGDESSVISLQLAIHNMLRVTWLKRLESSSASLLKSVEKYTVRLNSFEKWLDRGYILSFKDIDIVENDYGEDIEAAIKDFEETTPREDDTEYDLKQKGIERRLADPNKYDIDAIKKDIARDREIASILVDSLSVLADSNNDSKIQEFARYLESITRENKFGGKVLVFSYFADTISYLEKNLSGVINIPDFINRSAFLSGHSSHVNDVVKLFSPKSKKYTLKSGDHEIDFLFATDVLSEGQNLQDSGILVNYDLHWNPVRMIQRNGRINRLGSTFDEVIIANMNPENNIELYLDLVKRLERKIDTIKHTIGLDQGVLNEKDINPIEFVDDIKKMYQGNANEQKAIIDKYGEDADDVLSWTDDHVFHLRSFLETCTDEDKKRIQAMPVGKWNYLPSAAMIPDNTFIGLERVDGKTSITGTPISQTFFIKCKKDGDEIIAENISDFDAFQVIKATRQDNERRKDNINVDRMTVERRSKRLATTRATISSIFEIKGKTAEALEYMQDLYKDKLNLRPAVENGLKNAADKRRFEKIIRKINKEIREMGHPMATTINEFDLLMKKIGLTQNEKIIDAEATGILYYAGGNK